jgi:cytochrome P450
LTQAVGFFSAYPAIVNLDPPDHTKRRRTITKAFTPRAIAKLEEGIRTRARDMVYISGSQLLWRKPALLPARLQDPHQDGGRVFLIYVSIPRTVR